MADLRLRLLVAGSREASRQLRGARDDVDGVGGAMGRVAKIGKGFTGFMEGGLSAGLGVLKVGALAAGAAVVGIGVAFTGVMKTSLSSLARIEQINAQTASAIKSTGAAAGVTAEHIEEMTGALEGTTATEAESIQQGANLLLTFTNIRNGVGEGNDIFDQATKTITDMSRAMDTSGGAVIDTTGTAIQLGKALNDPIKGITALSKVGVSFSEEQKEMIKSMVANNDVMGAQKVILNELSKEFGGSGEAFAATSKGQIELAGHAWGTLGEAMATALLPAVGNVSTVMADSFNYLAEESAPKLEGVFTKLGDKVTDISYRVADAVTYVAAHSDLIKTQLASLAKGDTGAGGLAASIGGALGISAGTAQTKLAPALQLIADKGLQIATVLGTAFDTLQTIPISPLNLLNSALEWASTHTEEFKSALKGAFVAYVAIKAATMAFLIVQGAVAAVTVISTAATMAHAAAQKLSLSYMTTWIGVKYLEFTAWVRSTAATVASTVAMGAQKIAYGTGWLMTFIGVKGIEAGAWIKSTALAVANRAAIIAGAVASGIARGAILAWAAAQWLLNVALSANPIGLVIAAVALLVGGVVLAYQKSETFRGAVNWLWESIKTLGKWLGEAFLKFTPLGQIIMLVKNNFDSIKSAVGGFVDKIKDAWTWVKKLGDRLANSAIGEAVSSIGGWFGGDDNTRAAGGPVSAGRSYLVGEEGPEIVTPTRSGYVHTAEETARMSAPRPVTLAAPGAVPALSAEDEQMLSALDFTPEWAVYLDGEELTRSTIRHVDKMRARR